jgi:hypothetical protein
MNTEKQTILDMLAQGKISADEAARLLECLEPPGEKGAPGNKNMLLICDEPSPTREGPRPNGRLTGKKLRVEVKGFMEDGKKMDVNVSVPLVLARYVDNLIASCLPEAAHEELAKQGINLRQINIGQLVDALEDLDEDIVNADVKQDEMDLKVRVYVE